MSQRKLLLVSSPRCDCWHLRCVSMICVKTAANPLAKNVARPDPHGSITAAYDAIVYASQ